MQDAPLIRTISRLRQGYRDPPSPSEAWGGRCRRQNNEAAGGQDVFHIHFHVIPRFMGDRRERQPFAAVDESTRVAQAESMRQAWPST